MRQQESNELVRRNRQLHTLPRAFDH